MKFSAALLLVLWFGNGICFTNKPTRRTNANPNESHTNTIEYYTETVPYKISIPIMIHLDSELSKRLRKEHRGTVKKYFYDVLRSVESLYRHPSLNQTVHLNLLGVKRLGNATKQLMTENVSQYLKSYCEWQGSKKILKKKWYYSVLFTGLDVYYLDGKKNKVTSSHGRGYLRGICSMKNSCTVLEWHYTNVAYIMAHELAHSLGLNHDGPPYNQCRGQRYIMSPKYNPKNPAKTWSPCTKHGLTSFMTSKYSSCLQTNAPLLEPYRYRSNRH